MGGHVFISYRHDAATEYVDRLAKHLSAGDLPTWYDREIVSGDRWLALVRGKIDTCSAFVVVMSPEAEESEWVDREIIRAQQQKKPILPLLLSGTPFFRLGDLHFEDVKGGRMPGPAFSARLRSHLDAPRPQPAAVQPAAEAPLSVSPEAEPARRRPSETTGRTAGSGRRRRRPSSKPATSADLGPAVGVEALRIRQHRRLLRMAEGAVFPMIIALAVAMMISVAWLLREVGARQLDVGVGGCLRRDGESASVAPCTESGSYQVTAIVADAGECDSTLPHILNSGRYGRAEYLCLKPTV